MAIEIQTIEQVKTVSKPWGQEKWIQPGGDQYPFVLKELTLLAGQRTSLQVHEKKSESIYILKGTGQLLYRQDLFNVERYNAGQYNMFEIDNIINNLNVMELEPGVVFHTPPGTIHRMVATSDLVYIEASTTELDDVIRLQDDKNRQHGRIDSEHK
jgi:mannose-6-phosphate isomerase-like protein (cupin superfamily)